MLRRTAWILIALVILQFDQASVTTVGVNVSSHKEEVVAAAAAKMVLFCAFIYQMANPSEEDADGEAGDG